MSAGVHLLILTFKRPLSLVALLESVAAQSFRHCELKTITIWDNDPYSESIECFRRTRFSSDHRISYIVSEHNSKMLGKRLLEDRFFAKSVVGESDWIVHLDDDVVLTKTWLDTAICAAIERNWCASGSVEERYGLLVFSGQRQLRIEPAKGCAHEGRVWIWERHVLPENCGPTEVVFAGHRALAIRADFARHVRHDHGLIIGGEDLDYSLELGRAGGVIGIHPRSLIRHRTHGESSAAELHTHADVVASWRRFNQKWGFIRDVAWMNAGVTAEKWIDIVNEPRPEDMNRR